MRRQEAAGLLARTVLATWRAGDAYNRHVLTLAETDRLSTVTGLLLTGYQPDFAVLRGRELVGVVSRSAVLQALAGRADDPLVGEVMNPMCLKVDAGSSALATAMVNSCSVMWLWAVTALNPPVSVMAIRL